MSLYEPHAYSDLPRAGCAWHRARGDWPRLEAALQADVAIIGAGFTGLSAALHLAHAGADVVLLEAHYPGWGASGRNGGFCCLGGAKLPESAMRRLYGQAQAAGYEAAQVAAIETVRALLERYRIDARVHSEGELVLAHTRRHARALSRAGGGRFYSRAQLDALGVGGPFHAGLHVPQGFALEPGQYVQGLAVAAQSEGAHIFAASPVEWLAREDSAQGGWRLATPHGEVRANRLIVATNGYSSDSLPAWMRARFLPVQSSVLVTRPLSADEQAAQGWHSNLMAYDTRQLLHYFRLMPDGRFLFGMRGGIRSTPRSESATRARLRRHFRAMFPAWQAVEITHDWSGLACLTPALRPFVGPIGQHAWAGFGYHGNGVAMGSWAGARLAELALGRAAEMPDFLSEPPGRYALGRQRRLALHALYPAMALIDLF